jgi:steroid 5-alpha reductase family enzyme
MSEVLAPLLPLLILSAGTVFVYMNAWFMASLIKKRADIVDVAWGLGFVVIALVTYLQREVFSLRALIVLVLVALWGLRLGWHIHSRNHGKPEDFRYRQWREEWGKNFTVRSYFQVYMLQGFLMVLVAGSIIWTQALSPAGPLTLLDYLGMAVWGIGFYFEAVGDYQLAQYKKDPANKGKIIQTGLWQYTRHPNYFGEVILWWGIYLMALSVPYGAFSILAPITISFFILKVSGIPMLEAKYVGNPEFEAYKQRTNAFWPWFPKRG